MARCLPAILTGHSYLRIEHVRKGLETLEIAWETAERALVQAGRRRQDAVDQVVSPVVREAVAIDERRRDFSAVVSESIAKCLEVDDSLVELRAQHGVVVDRAYRIRQRIRMAEDQLALDGQLGQADQAAVELADSTIAYHEGRIAVVVEQLDVRGRKALTPFGRTEQRLSAGYAEQGEDASGVAATASPDAIRHPGHTNSDVGQHHSSSETFEGGQSSLQQALQADKARARLNLATAWQRFEEHRARYPADLFTCNLMQRPTATRTDFDQAYLTACRDWTTRTIAAEKMVEDANRLWESLEADVGTRVAGAKLERWLDDVGDESTACLETREPSDWPEDVEDAGLDASERDALVSSSDSIGCVARGKAGERMRWWKERRLVNSES
ncbi:hypothetical protein LTR36_006477 [Oleoguttula mirabilis]|uniref:Uncharacterized protein n=1 Tax=Oleoguttula mirabilis TaxID=1507867 RepID=A0AAV9JUS8_9PEZI|nr:hypothetical protein LTR36_006477 [Oleoguttula mirabilis]